MAITARAPESRHAWTAASEWAGVFGLWKKSSTVVTPASSAPAAASRVPA
ncbi:hypothetical protein [Actinomadura madurae]|nr:hypothetical protein [Actinomadura madurae]MCP9982768.1 hypothetical protein [Actinomadura madurae]